MRPTPPLYPAPASRRPHPRSGHPAGRPSLPPGLPLPRRPAPDARRQAIPLRLVQRVPVLRLRPSLRAFPGPRNRQPDGYLPPGMLIRTWAFPAARTARPACCKWPTATATSCCSRWATGAARADTTTAPATATAAASAPSGTRTATGGNTCPTCAAWSKSSRTRGASGCGKS